MSRRLVFMLNILGLLATTSIFVQTATCYVPTRLGNQVANIQDDVVQAPDRKPIDTNQLSKQKIAILFVGNSHTSYFDLKKLVANLIDFRFGSGHSICGLHSAGFLDGLMSNQRLLKQIESGDWDVVVLQAQQISSSGKYMYSTDEGVKLAKHAIRHGCKVFFFSERGIQGVPNHSMFTEKIYRSMADKSGAELIPVGRVWESVLVADQKIGLYSRDKNHQSRLGASLTALVIASQLTGEPADSFENFNDPVATKDQWNLFVKKLSEVQVKLKTKNEPESNLPRH